MFLRTFSRLQNFYIIFRYFFLFILYIHSSKSCFFPLRVHYVNTCMCFIVCSALKENSHELDIFLKATKLSSVSPFCLCAAGFQNFDLLIVVIIVAVTLSRSGCCDFGQKKHCRKPPLICMYILTDFSCIQWGEEHLKSCPMKAKGIMRRANKQIVTFNDRNNKLSESCRNQLRIYKNTH
jgi:hypothetical protein